jgi:hypothetical protein
MEELSLALKKMLCKLKNGMKNLANSCLKELYKSKVRLQTAFHIPLSSMEKEHGQL